MKIRMSKICLLIGFSVFWFNSFSQGELTEFHYSKIEVKPGAGIVSKVDSVHCDTLILGDNSRIGFTMNSIFIAKNAFIGKGCLLWAHDGGKGNDGGNGFDLYLSIFFRTLGSLTINTSGGRGEQGRSGSPGSNGSDGPYPDNGGDGGDGEDGGKGGDGGDIVLYYGFERNPPIFNGTGDNSLVLNYSRGLGGAGGNGGSGGLGGRGIPFRDFNGNLVGTGGSGSNGRNGSRGAPGASGKDGSLVFRRITN